MQVGICYAGKEGCRTSAALLSSFHPPYTGRLHVTVTPDGKILGVSWRAWTLSSPSSSFSSTASSGSNQKAAQEGRYREGGRGDFDIVLPASAPGVYVEKPATKGKGGGAGARKTAGGEGERKAEEEEEEAVDERSFLQKYVFLRYGGTCMAWTKLTEFS